MTGSSARRVHHTISLGQRASFAEICAERDPSRKRFESAYKAKAGGYPRTDPRRLGQVFDPTARLWYGNLPQLITSESFIGAPESVSSWARQSSSAEVA